MSEVIDRTGLESADWNHAEPLRMKVTNVRYCGPCHEEHDIGCFFRFRGGWMGCMINKASRAKSMAKIKGGPGAKK